MSCSARASWHNSAWHNSAWHNRDVRVCPGPAAHDDRHLQPFHAEGVSRSPRRRHSRPCGAHRVSPPQDLVGRRCEALPARPIRRPAAGALARQPAARAHCSARPDTGARAPGEQLARRALRSASRSIPGFRRIVAHEQYRRLVGRDRSCRDQSGRARCSGLHQRRGQAALGPRVSPDISAHGDPRPAGLGASDAGREFPRLCRRAGVRGGDLVQLRLAL